MAKGRLINKRIAKSDKIASLSKDRHRVIYFMLYPHLDCEGRYSADPRDIKEDCCPRLGYSLKEIAESLRALHEVGLIILYEVDNKEYLEVSRFDDFQVGLHKEREARSEVPANPGATPATAGPLPEASGPNQTKSEKVPLKVKVKSKVKVKVKSNTALRASVIAYLNEKTGKNFSPDSKTTVQLIDARLEEGRTLEDFKRVIDIKTAKWRGDSRMDDYLRPETLFNRTKMEAYLNENPPGALGGVPGARVGAHPTKTPEQKVRDRERSLAIKAEVEKLQTEYDPKISAAVTAGNIQEAQQIRNEANGKIEKFIGAWDREHPDPGRREAHAE